MFAKVYSAGLVGVSGRKVSVEVDISRGLPQMMLVGLPDASVSEAKERTRAAIRCSGFDMPLGRILINLAPGDLRKEGSHYDLAVAVGILIGSAQLEVSDLEDFCLIGELSLNGDLKPVHGALSFASTAKDSGCKAIIVPSANAEEAAYVSGLIVYGVENLKEVKDLLLHPAKRETYRVFAPEFNTAAYLSHNNQHDLKYIKGQYQAKRALEIAAAGGHNLLLIGQPGGGKSMLAQCLPGLMTPMSEKLALESTKVHSVAGLLAREGEPVLRSRPYRAPHHSISGAGLIGGGTTPRPGEISLSHNGVLFLDELAEFDKRTLDNLRQPMETGKVVISRARGSVEYPARFSLVAACNPYTGTRRPKARDLIISEPLWDRFALIVWVSPLKTEELLNFNPEDGLHSSTVRERVAQAAAFQLEQRGDLVNDFLTQEQIKEHCALGEVELELLRSAITDLDLSARSFDHILRTARTIADLELSVVIGEMHLIEALQYRISQQSILDLSLASTSS